MQEYTINAKELKVIELLNRKKFCTANEIAENLGVTSRTILNYIKNINRIIGKEVAEIKFTKNKKYTIKKINAEKFDIITNAYRKSNISFPEERIIEIIKILLEERKMIKIEDLAEMFFISRTTLIKDLKRISNILKNYNIELRGKPNSGIEAFGNEMNIRFCFSQIFHKRDNGIYKKSQKQHIGNNEVIIEKVLKQIFKKYNFIVSRQSFRNLTLHIFIALERYKKGYTIEKITEKVENMKDTKEYLISYSIGKALKKELDLELPEIELKYICLHLLGRKPVEEMIETNKNIEIKPMVKKMILKMLDRIYENTGFFMKDDREFILGLELHLNFAVNRIMFNMNIRNPLFREVKKKFPLAYELATIGASVIEEELNVKVNEHEISYLAMHIGGYIERNNYKYKDIQRVALICGTGLGTAQLMLVKIKKVLGNLQEIKTFSSAYLETEVLDEFDIIFTTIDLDINVSTPIIKLDILFDERDLQNKIFYRNIKQKIVQNSPYIFKSILKKNMFYKIDLETPKEIIEYMAEKCIENGKADEGFKDRLLERERLSPTSFDNYIALPHAINYKSDEIDIAIGILDKTVKWDEKPIKLVFLVLVPNEIVEDANLFIKVYEDILKVGQNKNLLQKMVKVNNFEEYVSLF